MGAGLSSLALASAVVGPPCLDAQSGRWRSLPIDQPIDAGIASARWLAIGAQIPIGDHLPVGVNGRRAIATGDCRLWLGAGLADRLVGDVDAAGPGEALARS